MSAPLSCKPSTQKVLGAFTLAGGMLLSAIGFGETIRAILLRDQQIAFAALVPLFVGLAVLCLAAALFGEAIDSLSWREFADPVRAFFAGDRIAISELPNELADAIRPLMGRTSRLTADELRERLAEATAVMTERAAFARAERDALEREMEFAQTRVAAAHLRRLSDEEKALLELSMRARAEADARAARDFERLERETAALRDACKTYAEFYCHNNSHKGERK